ncbi:MAG: sigma-70 family RNA polymerase sigma factor [Proteobacteria bacterium]|nr:sigma-70 family RNA polymerase sigma factor [Pseudomonadota bacterium]
MNAIACDIDAWNAPHRPRLLRGVRPQPRAKVNPRKDIAPASGVRHAELIAAVSERADRDAFAELFEHFAPRVKSYMLRLGAAPEAAEELAQEALLTVWRKAASFDPSRAAASTWIFTIARNLHIDALRRTRPPPAEDPADTPAGPATPDALVAAGQDEARLRQAIATLSHEQAEVIRLSFYADQPHAEIAVALGLPLGTVKSRLRLAMGRLRTLLGDQA